MVGRCKDLLGRLAVLHVSICQALRRLPLAEPAKVRTFKPWRYASGARAGVWRTPSAQLKRRTHRMRARMPYTARTPGKKATWQGCP